MMSKMTNFAPSDQGTKLDMDMVPTANACISKIVQFHAQNLHKSCMHFRAKCKRKPPCILLLTLHAEESWHHPLMPREEGLGEWFVNQNINLHASGFYKEEAA